MAVFTYIATTIATALGGTFLATLAGSIIAGGIAYGTARALGVFKPPSLDQGADPGVSIQLPPATDNKIPILYGKAFTSGPIFDAAISNSNKTMTYCIALSEETQTGTFSVGDIYMNDVELVFTGNTVTSHIDPNQSSATTYNGNVRVNVYQGGSSGSDVIFPTSGTGSSTAASAIVPHWGANHTANALVFAVLQIDYDAENGLTGLPQMTFEMTNSLNNPGDVLYDFLTSDRYGAKLNVSTTNKRYEINGMLSTFNSASTNIDQICQASATFFTYNVKDGVFAAIPNRAISTAEKANCLVYNDDNITSKIDISSTELYSLYNGIEIEFMDQNRKDQTNTILVSTPLADRNANEPENILNYKIDMINDNVRAERLANIDLNQSRVATVIQFESDFSGIQTDVGDIIKVTNSLYGWTDKLFRVMRVTEVSTEAGMINARMSCIEYSDDYYSNPVSIETPDIGIIDLPRIPIIGDIPIIDVFQGNYGNVDALPTVYGSVIPNQTMATFGAGAQLADSPAANTSVVSSTTFEEIIPVESYDISDSDIGDYEVSASSTLGGTITGAYDIGFSTNVKVTWANATASASTTFTGGGVEITNLPSTTPPPPLVYQRKINTDPVANGHPADMTPQTANIVLRGYSDIDTSNSAVRSFNNMNYEMLRVTKGEK